MHLQLTRNGTLQYQEIEEHLLFYSGKWKLPFFTDSDAILKILSVDFCGKVKVNSDSSSKIV